MADRSESRVAWIVGGSAGTGYAIAQSLVNGGYSVVISARNEDLLRTACAELRTNDSSADYVVADVARRGDVEQACTEILGMHGRIDVLVNSAGFNVKARTWGDLDPDEFDSIVTVNLLGTFYAIHAVLPTMRNQGSGVIVNVASLSGRSVAVPQGVAYTVAKHGVVTLTETINLEEYKNGIRACVVCPGGVNTRAHTSLPDEIRNNFLKPEDVAEAVRFAVDVPPHVAVYAVDICPTKRW